VQLKNTTSTTKTLTGWSLRDASSHIYSFPTFSLAAGTYVNGHTGSGGNTASNLYCHSSGYIWNNSGDTATLKNANGTVVDRCSYTSSADPEALC
jgi:predicted CxxxxCH...CXXCH cytochrome family protein